ncbi:hypothetical protein BDW74DRAFT_4376 [Aspergillus multicolor]|uniref:uncharacterized protein n=1 Tax=Aspergillus multicolor TaxID=41759 RepID=UPI003CCCADF5
MGSSAQPSWCSCSIDAPNAQDLRRQYKHPTHSSIELSRFLPIQPNLLSPASSTMYETPLCRSCGEPERGLAGISRSWYEVCPGCECINNGLKMCDVCMEGDEEVEGVCWKCNDEEWVPCSYECENGYIERVERCDSKAHADFGEYEE